MIAARALILMSVLLATHSRGETNPLAGLPALQKLHHSWPISVNYSQYHSDEVFVDARITGCIPAPRLRRDLNQETAHQTARIALRANVTVDLMHHPWLDGPFPPDAPPTYTGPEEAAELALFTKLLKDARQWIEVESDAVIGTVILDQERWNVLLNETGWSAAVTRKNNLIYKTVKAVLPNVSLQLYDRGGIRRGGYPHAQGTDPLAQDGWSANGYYTLQPDELGETFATSLYTVPEIGYTRKGFNLTAANARAHNKSAVTPWIALGQGYYRDLHFHRWDWLYNYNYAYSHMLGAEVNVPYYGLHPARFSEWGMAREIVLYNPGPFDTRTALVNGSSWRAAMNHFVMYVRGAHGIEDLNPVA